MPDETKKIENQEEQPKKIGLDPATLVALIDAALSFLQNAIPKIKEAFARGEISTEQQAKVDGQMQKLRETQFVFTRTPGT